MSIHTTTDYLGVTDPATIELSNTYTVDVRTSTNPSVGESDSSTVTDAVHR